MHSANASWIAWVLQLQSILRFPKHFFAPRPLLPHPINRVAPPTFSDRAPNWPSAGTAVPTTSSVAVMPPETYRLKGSSRPSKWLGFSQTRPPRAALTPVGIRQIKADTLSWRSGLETKNSGISDQQALTSTRYRLRSPDEASSRSPQSLTVSAPQALQFRRRMADVPLSARTAGIRASYSPVTPASSPNRGSAIFRAAPPSVGSSASLEPSLEVDSPSPERKVASGDNHEPASASGGTTLHVDGSALGRWTLQHLERALAKPTAGMTGVDPRANTPRGRVSPF
jgi:hypothetical protein